jgi:hypothetical protein
MHHVGVTTDKCQYYIYKYQVRNLCSALTGVTTQNISRFYLFETYFLQMDS